MQCQHCGAVIGDEDKFCKHCGQAQSMPAVIEPPPPDIGQTLDRAAAVVSLAQGVNQLAGGALDTTGGATCTVCGTANPPGAFRCSKCRTLLPPTEPVSAKVDAALEQAGAAVRIAQNVHALSQAAEDVRCPHCNTLNENGASTCTNCGTALPTPAAIDQALDHAAKVVEIATDLQTLAGAVQNTASTPTCAVCGANNPAEAAFCNRCGAPLTTVAQPEAGILTAINTITEQDAQAIAQKTLQRETIIAAQKTMLPLWRVQYHEKKGLFGTRQTDAVLYLNAYDGALLSVEKKAVTFIDDAAVNLDRIKTLDDGTRLMRRAAGQLLSAPLTLDTSKDDALHLARDVLRVDAFDAEIVLYPLWQFTIEHKRNGTQRTLLVDAVFGREVIAVPRPTQVAAHHVTPPPATVAAPAPPAAPVAAPRSAAPPPAPAQTAPQAPPASARNTIFIEGIGQQSSLESALKHAGKNARILVYPGTYREAFTITKPVEIIGVGGRAATVIETDEGLKVQSSGVTLRGLTVRSPTSTRHKTNTVLIQKGQLTLEDCVVIGGFNGVSALNGADLIARKCLIEGAQLSGISASDKGTTALIEDCTFRDHTEAGIMVMHKASGTIRNCTLTKAGKNGCMVHSNSKATLEHVTVTGSAESGFHINYEAVVTLKHCTASGNQCGLLASSEKTTKAEQCEFSQNSGCGIIIDSFSILELNKCTVEHNGAAGVLLAQASKGSVNGCTIRGNRGGPWQDNPPNEVKRGRNKT